MKRKEPLPVEPVIDKAILDLALRSAQADKPVIVQKCSVCGSQCAPNSNEGLCWVCRRLKISAWAEIDQQAAQE